MADPLKHIEPGGSDDEETGDESSTEAGQKKNGVQKVVVSGRRPDNYPRDPLTDRPIPPDPDEPNARDMCRRFVQKELLWQIRKQLLGMYMSLSILTRWQTTLRASTSPSCRFRMGGWRQHRTTTGSPSTTG